MNEQALSNYFSKAHGVTLLHYDFDIIADNAIQKWISIDEQVPPFDEQVIVFVAEKYRSADYYAMIAALHEIKETKHGKKAVFVSGATKTENVIFWMPLPEPPLGFSKHNP